MAKCTFSQNNLCQTYVIRDTDTKPTCDGHHAACSPSKGLNIEDIRFRKQPLEVSQETSFEYQAKDELPNTLTKCPHCGLTFDQCHHFGLTFDQASISLCPYCGKEPYRPKDCPDPLCVLDLTDNPTLCLNCPKKPKPHRGWGGKRAGAGAPQYNLNRLKHGKQSALLKKGIERMADDPVMSAVLIIVARLAIQGEVPPQTKQAIQTALRKKGVKL